MKIIKLLDNGEPARAPLSPQTDPPLRILVAEDDPIIRRCSAETLARAGYAVDAAADGAAAWESLSAGSYDLLVTDYIMPKVSGMELCGKLRAARMALPVILMSGALPTEELERLLWLKFAALLSKPFSTDALLSTVNNILHAPGDAQNHTGAWFPFPYAHARQPMPPSRWGINE